MHRNLRRAGKGAFFTKSQSIEASIDVDSQRPVKQGSDHDHFLAPMTLAAPLTILGLTCRYGERTALDQISLTLEQGEILGITGSPGAGVSTLIKAVMLLVAPQAGRVLIYGRPHELASSRDHLAYLPQAIRPPGHLSGDDFIKMARTVQAGSKTPVAIERFAGDLDFEPGLLRHPIRRYTKDDVQKLGLLTLFATGRPIFLLDHPMSDLEPAARAGLRHLLKTHADNGGAVLIGSSCIEDHHDIVDRLLLLKNGKLAELETGHLLGSVDVETGPLSSLGCRA